MIEKIWNNFYNSVIFEDRYKYIFEGLFNTITMAIFACIIGVIIGLILALINDYNKETGKLKIANKIGNLYITIIRGTPVLLQLMIIYYVIFKSVDTNIILIGILAFGLNSGAYVSQIIKTGLISISAGQREAGKSLGLSYGQITRYIIMPQAIRNIKPALGNEFITLLKETSVAGYIGIVELTKASDIIASRTYDYFFPLIITSLIYLTLTVCLSKLINRGDDENALNS
jgi:arginine/lysine/histidine transport system permease protein